MSTSIGNRSSTVRLDVDGRAILSDRVLACLATWVLADGMVVEPTTGDIAARLGISPATYLRDELNHILRALRERRLVKYEHDPATGLIRWRLGTPGWIIAWNMSTGVTGLARSTDDRSWDRFAQVRDGAVRPRRDPRPEGQR